MKYIYNSPYYQFIEYLSFDTTITYKKFLNVVIGRFDLYQIEEDSTTNLKIYFPNGFFEISLLNNNGENRFKFVLKSKNTKKAKEMKGEVLNVYNCVSKL